MAGNGMTWAVGPCPGLYASEKVKVREKARATSGSSPPDTLSCQCAHDQR
jgi:hypothetical protein